MAPTLPQSSFTAPKSAFLSGGTNFTPKVQPKKLTFPKLTEKDIAPQDGAMSSGGGVNIFTPIIQPKQEVKRNINEIVRQDPTQGLIYKALSPISGVSDTITSGLKSSSEIYGKQAQAVTDWSKGVQNSPGLIDLGERFKAKYPGVYDSIDSEELGKKVLEKYPVYQSKIDEQRTLGGTATRFLGGAVAGFAGTPGMIGGGAYDIGTGVGNALTTTNLQEKTAGLLQAGKGALQAGFGVATPLTPVASTVFGGLAGGTDTGEKAMQYVGQKSGDIGASAAQILGGNQAVQEQARGLGEIAVPALALGATAKTLKYSKPLAQATGRAVVRGAEAVAPAVVQWAKTASIGAGNLTKSIISQQSGLGPSAIESIIKNPELQAKIRSGELSGTKALEEARTSIDALREGYRETGKMYDTVRKANIVVPKSEAKQAILSQLESEGLATGGKLNLIDLPVKDRGAITQALKYIDEYGDTMTPQNALSIRQKLDDLINYKSDVGSNGKRIVQGLRAKYDEFLGDKLPGLKEIDAKYAPEKEFWSTIRKDIYKEDGTLKDNALSVMSNLTNKGNEARLARMESILPGIGERIKALKAFDDVQNASGIKVGTYTRAATTGGLALVNPLLAFGTWVATHPVVVARALESIGLASNKIKTILSRGKNITKADSDILKEVVGKIPRAKIENIINNLSYDPKTNKLTSKTLLKNGNNSIRTLPIGNKGNIGKVEQTVNIPGSKKTTIETPRNPKGNESKILAKKQGVMVEPRKLLPARSATTEKARGEYIKEVNRDVRQLLNSVYNANKPEGIKSYIYKQIADKKITTQEGIDIIDGLIEKGGSLVKGADIPHYERILNEMYNSDFNPRAPTPTPKKLTIPEKKPTVDFEDLMKEDTPDPVKFEKPKTPRDEFSEIEKSARDGRFNSDTVDQKIKDFKEKYGKDPYDLEYSMFDEKGNLKSTTTKGQIDPVVDWKPTKGSYKIDNIKISDTNSFTEGYHGNGYKNSDSYKYWIEKAKKGDDIPTVVVEKKGEKYHILDGYHRLAAAKDAGMSRIKALIIDTPIVKGVEGKGLKQFTKFTKEELDLLKSNYIKNEQSLNKPTTGNPTPKTLPKTSGVNKKGFLQVGKSESKKLAQSMDDELVSEAKKYKSADDFVDAVKRGYKNSEVLSDIPVIKDIYGKQVQIGKNWYSENILPKKVSEYKIGEKVPELAEKKVVSKEYGVKEVDSDLFRESGANTSHTKETIQKYTKDMEEYGGWGDFPSIGGRIDKITKQDYQRYLDMKKKGAEGELAYSRPLKESDIGREIVQIENGHNRAYAAAKLGIKIKVTDLGLQEQANSITESQLRKVYEQAHKPKKLLPSKSLIDNKKGYLQVGKSESKKLTQSMDDELVSEAKKYKSVGEFVKAQGEPVYHGTNKNFEEFKVGLDSERGLLGSTYKVKTNGIFFTDNAKTASEYGKNVVKSYVKPNNTLIPKDIKTATDFYKKVDAEPLGEILTNISKSRNGDKFDRYIDLGNEKIEFELLRDGTMALDDIYRFAEGGLDWRLLDNSDFIKGMKDKGFDSTYVYEPNDTTMKSLFVLDTSKIKTESQLRKVYEQAHKPKKLTK